jgi:protein-S-isoprenylcysteine O-methyltransferase Ste14
MDFLRIENVGTLTLILGTLGAVLCLASYAIRLAAHVDAWRSARETSSVPFGLSLTVTFAGYLGWGYWSAADPVKMDIPPVVGIAVGVPLAAAGLALFLYAEIRKRGVGDGHGLVTTGIYAKIRHPMYLGLVLLHAGYPLVYRSFVAWASTLLWAAFIATWTRFEEKVLERRYGEAYRRYRRRTWF